MIKVNNLSKEFHEQGTSNELLAVDHVDFTIQNGSFCALVGESGSGKSTLAQLMCGLLVPSSGEVLFEGKNISLCRGKQKQVLRSKIQLILQDGKGASQNGKTPIRFRDNNFILYFENYLSVYLKNRWGILRDN